MRELVEHIAKALVDDVDSVKVNEVAGEKRDGDRAAGSPDRHRQSHRQAGADGSGDPHHPQRQCHLDEEAGRPGDR